MHPRPVAAGGVEQDPEELWASVVGAGRQAVQRARRAASARSASPIRARRCSRGIAPRGRPLSPAISWQDRRATGVCERLAGYAQRPDGAHRAAARSVLRGAEDAWLREHADARRRVHDDRRLAAAPADRRLRHRRGDGVAHAAARSRSRHVVTRGLCGLRDRSGRAAGDRRLRRARRRDDGLRCAELPVTGLAVDQQAALFARGLSRRRRGEVHVRHRRLPARDHRRAQRALARGPGRLRRVAARRRDDVLPRRPGLHRRRGRRVAAARRPHRATPATSTRSADRSTDSDGVVFVPALAGLARAVLAAGGARHLRRPVAGDRARRT